MSPTDLLGSGRTRGLSGDAERVLPAAPGLAFYDQFLRRHHTTEDLVADPTPIWDGPAPGNRRCGLRRHLVADPEGGLSRVTDVLVVVNRPDWKRALSREGEQWPLKARQLLRERFRAWCLASGVELRPEARPVDFLLVEDGGTSTLGEDLGLRAGDFVTGLLPNLHLGAESASVPWLSIQVQVPGEDGGWRRVATLYRDQALLTLGSHWLDNGRIPSLGAPAVYQVQHPGADELVHLVHPELRHRFRVSTRQAPGGQPLVLIESISGRPLAWVAVSPLAEPVASKPAEAAPARILDEVTLQDPHTEEKERIRTLDGEVPDLSDVPTVGPHLVGNRIFTLKEQGALLQAVHFPQVMVGYDISVDAEGNVASRLDQPVARLQVRERDLSVLSLEGGVSIQGQPLRPGEAGRIEGDAQLLLPRGSLEIRDLRKVEAEGWPYLAELRRPGDTVHAVFGGRFLIGRGPRCKVRLPDDPWNENIAWRPQATADSSIRSRRGELPRSRFYLDAILVATEHAEVDLSREPMVHAVARGCSTYVRRKGDIIRLPPVQGEEPDRRAANLDLLPGDELLIGNCVLEVDYPPADRIRPVRTRHPDPGPLRATDLAAAVSLDEPPPRLPRVEHAPGPREIPVAHGLGERGPVPPKVALDSELSEDSLEVPTERLREVLHESGPDDRGVWLVDEIATAVELARPGRLAFLGWQLKGTRRWLLGNHVGADLIVPETRPRPGEARLPADHLAIETRGESVVLVPLSEGCCRLVLPSAGPPGIEIDRLNTRGDASLVLHLQLLREAGSPPILMLDRQDRMIQGLFTHGLLPGETRKLYIGRHPGQARLQGETLSLSWAGGRRVLGRGERVVIDGMVFAFEADPP